MKEYLGHAIRDGQMLYTSVSSVKGYAKWSKGGCARRWLYARVLGLKEAEANRSEEAKNKGTALDKELKNYLLTGDKTLSSLALKGLHILEKPGPGLAIDPQIYTAVYRDAQGNIAVPPPMPEGDARPELPPGWTVQIQSPLTAAGIPFVGELDFAHARGHYRDADGEYHDDPPGTVEVVDIKFKSNTQDRNKNSIMLLPTDLVRDIQMAGYGEWVGRVRPDTTHVRLSHAVYPEKDGQKAGTPTKITRLHVLEDCHNTWARVESTVAEMKQLVAATAAPPGTYKKPPHLDDQTWAESVEKVAALAPGATESCDAYGGCHHALYCTAYRQNSLDKMYGKIAADHVAANNANPAGVYGSQQQLPGDTVGLMANNPQLMNPNATPAVDMRQQLADEDARQRQQVAQQQQQMPQALNLAELSQVCIRLNGYGYGFPTLAGNAAQAYAMVGGQSIAPGVSYPGVPAQAGSRRSLHGIQLTEAAHIYQLEGELAKELAAAQPTPQVFTPPPAPPAPAPQYAPPAQQPAQQPAQASAPQASAPQAMGFLPPDAPQSMPQLAMQQPRSDVMTPPSTPDHASTVVHGLGAFTPSAMAAEAPAAPKKGRPKKDKSQDVAPGALAAEAQAPTPSSPAPATQGAPVAASPIAEGATQTAMSIILINARSSKDDTKSLSEYVDYINRTVADRYNRTADGKQGISDVRAAMKDSILAYGGWAGVVREIVKAEPPPEGRWHLDTFADNVSEAVADALRVVADAKGWTYVRGMRG